MIKRPVFNAASIINKYHRHMSVAMETEVGTLVNKVFCCIILILNVTPEFRVGHGPMHD